MKRGPQYIYGHIHIKIYKLTNSKFENIHATMCLFAVKLGQYEFPSIHGDKLVTYKFNVFACKISNQWKM